jgi:RimJ/RimL family protein N-acetyltransferase
VTVVLTCARHEQWPALLLRPWAEADLPGLLGIYRDPAMRRDSGRPLVTMQDARRWLAVQERGWDDGSRLSFAVLAAEPVTGRHQLAGNVVLRGRSGGEPSAEVGYWTAAPARGRGIACGALHTLTGWAFDCFRADGLRRLRLLHQVDNHASCRVAQKCGYDLEDVLPASPPAFPLAGHCHVRCAPR